MGAKVERNCCPVCGHKQLESLLTFSDIPVFVNVLCDTPEQAKTVTRGTQRLVQCLQCGFVFNEEFEPVKTRYSTGYHAERGQSPSYSQHIQHVLDMVSSVEPLQGKQVLEVACGTGEFLQAIALRGTLKCTGVDPSSNEVQRDGMEIHRALFDADYLHQNPQRIDLLVNRHMIEHMLEPLEMLRTFAQALPQGGLLYLETPRLNWILENRVFFDFPYEHCAYYSDDFICRLLTAAGFSIVLMQPSYQGQYFSICARKYGEPSKIKQADVSHLLKIRQSFSKMAQVSYGGLGNRQDCRFPISLAASEGIYLWGAAAKGVMCANLLKGIQISGYIDKNPYKQGKYIPGTGHLVIAPEDINFPDVQVVLVENDVYLEEIQLEMKEIDSRVRVCSLHQLLNIGTDSVELFHE